MNTNGEGHSRSHSHPFRQAKLDFPRHAGDDPTIWLDRMVQYFDYQGTPEDHKVTLAVFHLEGEANQWWQWMKKVHREGNQVITWEIF